MAASHLTAMARSGDRRSGVLAVLVVLAVLGVTAARVVIHEVQVRLGHVTQDQAELLVVKTNSTASQVVVTLTRWEDSVDFQQHKAPLNPNVTSERKTLLFSNLDIGTEYRICSSVRDDRQLVSDGQCFSFTTFEGRSLSKAIVSGVVAALVVGAGAALLCLLFKVVLRRRKSKTLIVTDKTDRENDVTNSGAELPS